MGKIRCFCIYFSTLNTFESFMPILNVTQHAIHHAYIMIVQVVLKMTDWSQHPFNFCNKIRINHTMKKSISYEYNLYHENHGDLKES